MPAPAPAETTTAASLDAFNASWDVFFAAVRRARGRAQRAGDDPAELSLSQYHLLAGLMDEPKLPVGELALRAGVSGPTATRALDGLARRGLVRREPSPVDRRIITIRLTPAGERALARKRAVILGRRAELFDELAPAEREQAQRLLRRLGELIDQW
jgi:DNA-binding MarR family transcriptional regulator